LTNHPALHGIPALVADDAAGDEGSDSNINSTTQRKNKMDNLIKLLGLVAFVDKTDEEKETAVNAKVAELVKSKEAAKAFLKLHDCETFDKVTGKIQGMVPAEEKTRLQQELVNRDAEQAVKLAFDDGKLSEAYRAWALDFAKRDLKAFGDWAKGAPKLIPDGKGTEQKPPENTVVGFSDEEKKILRNCGLTDEQINKLNME
jgi:hypothetical protein